MKIENVGITGSRNGLNQGQRDTLETQLHTLFNFGARILHHGDCVGVDADACEIAASLGYQLVAHPPTNPKLRAYVYSDLTREPSDYLDRDRTIVDCVDFLIGCPDGPPRPKSGTWYTINYARSTLTRFVVIRPDGFAWTVDNHGEWEIAA